MDSVTRKLSECLCAFFGAPLRVRNPVQNLIIRTGSSVYRQNSRYRQYWETQRDFGAGVVSKTPENKCCENPSLAPTKGKA
jgi:hypothetical protein